MIRRHIGINYSGTGQEIYTDGKWLAFMLEQILSNAIKYTPHGVVTIETAEEKRPVFYYNKGYRNRNQSRGSATCF